jgi:hypothetical protein
MHGCIPTVPVPHDGTEKDILATFDQDRTEEMEQDGPEDTVGGSSGASSLDAKSRSLVSV